MWLTLAFISTLFLGIYDVSKKIALKSNAVLPVLVLSTGISALLFSPIILSSSFGLDWFSGSFAQIPKGSLTDHLFIISKSLIVVTSWICSYYGLKNTPISIYGPINATRPVFVLLGAMLIFRERLNLIQWAGVAISIFSIYMLGVTSRKKEGIDFRRNRAIFLVLTGTIIGASSALYDRYLLRFMDSVFVQGWSCIYEFPMMCLAAMVIWFPHRHRGEKFRWSWSIPLISVALTTADFAYFHSLSYPDAMVSMVSMIRRGSVIISFLCAALIFREKNLRSKAVDLGMIFIGMALLYIGSR